MNLYKIIYVAIFFGLFIATACSPFEKEIKQDQKLKYYRHLITYLNDSLDNTSDKIMLYSDILDTLTLDKTIYSRAQRNRLTADIYNIISFEYASANRLDSAWVYTNKALSLDSVNVNFLYNKGCLAQDLGQDSIAMHLYDKCSQMKYNNADLYYNRGLLFYKKQLYKAAIEDYQKAIDMNPNYAALVYNNQGSAYFQMEEYYLALDAYKKAIQSDSTLSQIYVNMGDTYLKLNEKANADLSFLKALDLQNNFNSDASHKKLVDTTLK